MPDPWSPNGGFYFPEYDRDEESSGGYAAQGYPAVQPGTAKDVPDPRQATGYAAAMRAQPQGTSLGIPPLMMHQGQAVIAGTDGNPVMNGDQPLTLDQYHRAVMGSQPRSPEQQAHQDAASYNSGLRWGPPPQQDAGDALHADVAQKIQYLSGVMGQIQQDPNLTSVERSHALSHVYQQFGHLTQMAQQRAAAHASGAVPPGQQTDLSQPAPKVDAESQKSLAQLHKAEAYLREQFAQGKIDRGTFGQGLQRIQQRRDSVQQQALPDDTQSIQQQIQGRRWVDHETGMVHILQKDGKIESHPIKEGKAKEEGAGFDGLPFAQKHKLLEDLKTSRVHADGSPLTDADAIQYLRGHEKLFGGNQAQGGNPAQGPSVGLPLLDPRNQQRGDPYGRTPPTSAAHDARTQLGSYLSGDRPQTVQQLRALAQSLPPDATKWLATITSPGVEFTGDPETLGRAKQLIAATKPEALQQTKTVEQHKKDEEKKSQAAEAEMKQTLEAQQKRQDAERKEEEAVRARYQGAVKEATKRMWERAALPATHPPHKDEAHGLPNAAHLPADMVDHAVRQSLEDRGYGATEEEHVAQWRKRREGGQPGAPAPDVGKPEPTPQERFFNETIPGWVEKARAAKDPAAGFSFVRVEQLAKQYADKGGVKAMTPAERWEWVQGLRYAKKYDPSIDVPDPDKIGATPPQQAPAARGKVGNNLRDFAEP